MQQTYGKDILFNFYKLTNEDLKYIKKFDCGNCEINKYFNNEALNDSRGVTKVIWRKYEESDQLDKDKSDLIGLYSLNASGMFYDEYKDKRFLIPAIEIKFFAINETYQNMPYSEDEEDGVFADYLLASIIDNIREITEEQCGADKIILFSVPNAVAFYERNGFEQIEYKDIELLRFLDGTKAMAFDLSEW